MRFFTGMLLFSDRIWVIKKRALSAGDVNFDKASMVFGTLESQNWVMYYDLQNELLTWKFLFY